MEDGHISLKAAKNAVQKHFDNGGFNGYVDAQKMLGMIYAIPIADVVEVRHGRWHRYSKGSGSYNGVIILSDAFQCTICKESFWNKSNYCPNCGAKMDGGQEG